MAKENETKKDDTDANFLEASSLDFHTYIQNEDATCKARMLKSIEQLKILEGKFLELQLENAATMSHDLFSNIEKLRKVLEEDLSETSASDLEDECFEENIEEDSNDSDVNPNENANTESDEDEQME